MEVTVKEFKSLIQEEFSKFHSLLDRREQTLTTKLDEYLNSQKQEKELNVIKFENTTGVSSVDTSPPSQLSVLQFIAEDSPNNFIDKKPQIFEIKFQIHKGPVEKEIEQCGEIVMEQLAELSTVIHDTPVNTPQQETPPADTNISWGKIKQEMLETPCESTNERSSCSHEEVSPMDASAQPNANSWCEEPLPEHQEETVQQESHYDAITNMMNKVLKRGDIWCLVSCSWFKKWRLYASNKPAYNLQSLHPGPIDNSNLFCTSGLVKRGLVHNLDYKLVPEAAWKLLIDKFGANGTAIRRWVVEYGSFRKSTRVEVYLLALNCQILNGENKENKVVHMSRMANFYNLETQVKQSLNLNAKTSLNVSYKTDRGEWNKLDDLNANPQVMGMFDGQQIRVEVQQRNGCKNRVRMSNEVNARHNKKAKFS